ncbi:hypothetical protein BH09PSE2_BH09PSE2_01510 [soil metagenome]
MKSALLLAAALLLSTPAAAAAPKAAAPPATPPISTAAERAFLAQTAKAPGVTSLPGIAFSVVTSGPADGAHPRGPDEITVRYKGSLSDGSVFDSSAEGPDGTATFPLNRLIPGWQAALKLMRPGDRWKIYIPAYMAYGPSAKPKIPADSPLVFEIELVSFTPPTPQ